MAEAIRRVSMVVISLKTESDVYVGGPHRPGRRRQAVLHGTDHRVHVGNVDVMQSVVGLEPQLDAFAAALAANSEVASKRRVKRPRPWPGNGIASRVAKLSRRWSGEGVQIEVSAPVDYRQARGFGAPAADHAGASDVGLIAQDPCGQRRTAFEQRRSAERPVALPPAGLRGRAEHIVQVKHMRPVETREPAFGAQIESVLRDDVANAAERGAVVNG